MYCFSVLPLIVMRSQSEGCINRSLGVRPSRSDELARSSAMPCLASRVDNVDVRLPGILITEVDAAGRICTTAGDWDVDNIATDDDAVADAARPWRTNAAWEDEPGEV